MPCLDSIDCSSVTSRSISAPCWRWITIEDWNEMKASSRTEKTMKIRIKTAVRRNVVVRSSCPSLFTDHVPGAPDGLQQRRVEAAIDLGAQPRHMHVDDVGLRVEMVVPDV